MLNVNLQQGNCLELMKDVPDKSIDMILCDLPYGTTKNKWDIGISTKQIVGLISLKVVPACHCNVPRK